MTWCLHIPRRNNGIFEPETRLVAIVPYDHYWPWQAIVIIAYACLGMQVSALPSIESPTAIDSLRIHYGFYARGNYHVSHLCSVGLMEVTY
jgi:hypothetical protein